MHHVSTSAKGQPVNANRQPTGSRGADALKVVVSGGECGGEGGGGDGEGGGGEGEGGGGEGGDPGIGGEGGGGGGGGMLGGFMHVL